MKITMITWKAFGSPADAVIAFEDDMSDLQICDEIFAATNTYSGRVWDAIVRVLPTHRTHTALSVGDEIDVDGTIYRCEPIGWEIVDKYEVDNFSLSIRDL